MIPATVAHADLMRAIKKYSDESVSYKFDPAFVQTRAGGIHADGSFVEAITEMIVRLGTPGIAAAFLIYARPIIIKWIEVRGDKQRSVELRTNGDVVSVSNAADIDEAVEALKKIKAQDDKTE